MLELDTLLMQFDDRLATVLRHRAGNETAARTQFRQLLDLLGRHRKAIEQKMLAAGWLRLGALSENIPAAERAHMISEPGLRLRNPELVLHLASDEPVVASAALARTQLSEDEWTALIPRLPIRARGFLRLRKDLPKKTTAMLERLGVHDRGLPRPVQQAEIDLPGDVESEDVLELEGMQDSALASASMMDTISDSASDPEPDAATHSTPKAPLPEAIADAPSKAATTAKQDTSIAANENGHSEESSQAIGALVERIEAYQQARNSKTVKDQDNSDEAPTLPMAELQNTAPQPNLRDFSFTTDVEGRIDWADIRVAPMVIGQRLDSEKMRRAILLRQPISGAKITITGADAICGKWVVDAVPRFTAIDASFFGYAGKFRRSIPASTHSINAPSEADSLRQLLHELRTPINAIQGFAEVIQQQVFGPTPHEYRAIAANIVGDSARIMAGFDEIDRLARLETGAAETEVGQSRLDEIVNHQIERLQPALSPRGSGFTLRINEPVIIAMTSRETQAMAWRILATLAAAMQADERLRLLITNIDQTAQLICDLPEQLTNSEDIFAAKGRGNSSLVTPGTFGPGFALRLARAEARSAKGELSRVDDRLVLELPALTNQSDLHSTEDALSHG